MKALIARQLYWPALVLPLLMLASLLVALDFSVVQVTLMVALKGSRYMMQRVFRRRASTAANQAATTFGATDGCCHG